MVLDIKHKMESYDDKVKELFMMIRQVIIEIAPEVEEKMWAGLPSYYKQKKFIRIIPFKSYVNLEATSIVNYKAMLKAYTITPKGMLKIPVDQAISRELLEEIITSTLLD